MSVDVSARQVDLSQDPSLSLFQLLDPKIHADPYPFYQQLRERSPVHWDPFMHTWVVTRYDDVLRVLHEFSADRTPQRSQIEALGMPELGPVAELMSKQMLFLDQPAHARLRKLCSSAFTSRRIEVMEEQIEVIANELIDAVAGAGRMDVIADFAEPFPSIVAAQLLGVPVQDHRQLKSWSATFAEMLGNFQHNPDRVARVRKTVTDMTDYFREQVRVHRAGRSEGLIGHLINAEVDGTCLSEDEVIANTIVTMVGGQETTTNLIASGLLSLIRQPDRLAELRDDETILKSGIEELLRWETPSQHTARIAPEDTLLGGKLIKKGDAVMAVMAAANRDPDRFSNPDSLDLRREDNRHLSFGWAAHFCFGAALARMESRIAFSTLLRRLGDFELETDNLEWRTNSGLRGLTRLPIRFRSREA